MGDFFKFVKQVPSNSIDLVEIDPPYAIKLDKVKKREGLSNYSYGETGYNEIQADDYPDFLNRTITESVRIMSEHSWLLCWFGPEPWFSVVLEILRRNKLQVRGMPCIWAKGEPDETGLIEQTSGQTLTPMRHLANAYEMFFYAKKGDPRINRQGMTNVFGYKPVPVGQKIHPTERPKEMMQDILTTFVPEGSKVVVPFAGSGNTILAAYESKMTAVGFDLGVEHKESYVARLVT
ncbi:MAG: site-specific DNA-methyltransferase [Gammaproteobacteria bacterium]|nr:site-specific DNA-methyltransferase [Gammaproteobacteria bacterium]